MYNYFLVVGKINTINKEDKTIEIIDNGDMKNNIPKQIITIQLNQSILDEILKIDANSFIGIKGRILADDKINHLIADGIRLTEAQYI